MPTVKYLKSRCKELNIKVPAKCKKSDIVKLLGDRVYKSRDDFYVNCTKAELIDEYILRDPVNARRMRFRTLTKTQILEQFKAIDPYREVTDICDDIQLPHEIAALISSYADDSAHANLMADIRAIRYCILPCGTSVRHIDHVFSVRARYIPAAPDRAVGFYDPYSYNCLTTTILVEYGSQEQSMLSEHSILDNAVFACLHTTT